MKLKLGAASVALLLLMGCHKTVRVVPTPDIPGDINFGIIIPSDETCEVVGDIYIYTGSDDMYGLGRTCSEAHHNWRKTHMPVVHTI